MENAAFNGDFISLKENLKPPTKSQFSPVKETGEQIFQVETIEASSRNPQEPSRTCATCSHERGDHGDKPTLKIQQVNWSPVKAKIFVVVLGCFVVWAAVFFTLSSYDYL